MYYPAQKEVFSFVVTFKCYNYINYLYSIRDGKENSDDLKNLSMFENQDLYNENNLKVLAECNLKMKYENNLLPIYECPDYLDSFAYLKKLIMSALPLIISFLRIISFVNCINCLAFSNLAIGLKASKWQSL